MKMDQMTADFSDEQKRYLEGFMSGVSTGRLGRSGGGAATPAAEPEPTGPDAAHLKAQDRFLKDGKKLSDPEKFKREQHPFDAYERLKAQARDNAAPPPPD
ncbi:MAG: NirA family protein, partial [Rhizobiales bacterium]|nr:NirA family protein [Hyphomicrobiales bacterium]